MVVYKDKACIDCNIRFIPTSGSQIRCGNYKTKYGCAYERRLLLDRELKTKIIPRKGSIIYKKDCLSCNNKTNSVKPSVKYCKDCAIIRAKQQRKLLQPSWAKLQRDNNPGFKIRYSLSNQLRESLKGKSAKALSCTKYLGCTVNEWRQYLESNFIEDMSWHNHGKRWDIDHIIPLSSFDFTKEENIYKAFNYKNTQPLDSYVNRHIKRDRLDYIK
jgi:hypothetical protein